MNEVSLEDTNQTQKRDRKKKYDFDYTDRKEYDKKRYQLNKTKLKDKYSENRDEIKEKSKEFQAKYRECYRLLSLVFNNNQLNTDKETYEKIKKILE